MMGSVKTITFATSVALGYAGLVACHTPVEALDRSGAGDAARGAQHSMKGWELYVWSADGEPRFSLLVGTNRLKTPAEIFGDQQQDSKVAPAVNVDLAGIRAGLAQLAPGNEIVVWGVRRVSTETRALVPVTDDVAARLRDYANEFGLQMDVPD